MERVRGIGKYIGTYAKSQLPGSTPLVPLGFTSDEEVSTILEVVATPEKPAQKESGSPEKASGSRVGLSKKAEALDSKRATTS
jgi:hypothetical protein